MAWCDASAAATASLVESGLDAHSAMSAPPALRVSIRLAVSLVTCRHAARRRSFNGCSLVKRSRIRLSTGISRAAQSTRSWPCVARFRSFTSLPLELTFKSLLLVDDLTNQLDVLEPFASLQVTELDQDLDADDIGAELTHQAHRRRGRAAGGQDIIHDQDRLAGLDRVRVDLQRVGPVPDVLLELLGGRHANTERKYPRVRPRPSPSLTSGSQPISSRA